MKIPEGWNVKQVGDLFELQLGKMLNKEALKKNPQFFYLGNSNVQWGRFDLTDLKKMHFNDKDIVKFTLQKNDILVCEGGEVGRCAIWKENHKTIFYQKALHRLRSKGEIIPEFFQNYMEKIAGTKLLDDYTTRTSIAHLTQEKLAVLPVYLPPLVEQKEIVQIVSTWDKAISVTEQLLENSQQQKKALMQQLLTGKKRLLDEQKSFCDPWVNSKIRDMGKITSGGTPDTENLDYWNGTVPWLTPTDVTALKSAYVSSTSRKITELGVNESSATLLPKESLMVCTRATIGSMAISTVEMCTNQGFKNITPNKNFEVKFIYYLLSFNIKELLRKSSGSTFLELSKMDFENIELFCPAIKEQRKIAEVLSVVDQETETLQKKLDCLKQEKKALMQQLLTGKKRVKVVV